MKFIDFTIGLNYQDYHSRADSMGSQVKELLEKHHVIVVAEDIWTPYNDDFFHIVDPDDYFTLSYVAVYNGYDSEQVVVLISSILERIQMDDSLLFLGDFIDIAEEEGLSKYISERETDEIKKLIAI